MADFSITRVPDRNLFGLLFPPLTDISEYEIEVIQPEYIDGYRCNIDGSLAASSLWCYAVEDVSKYDYVLMPLTNKTSSGYSSGLNDVGVGASFANFSFSVRATSFECSCYALMPISGTTHVAIINTLVDYKLPLVGFKRHRSDGVNPKSPLNEPDVKEELIEEPVIKDEPIEEPVEKTIKRSTKK